MAEISCKLFQLVCADRTRSADADDDGPDALPEDRRQVEAGSDVASAGWRPAVVRRCNRGRKITQDRAKVLFRFPSDLGFDRSKALNWCWRFGSYEERYLTKTSLTF